jgi:hypothetical protein
MPHSTMDTFCSCVYTLQLLGFVLLCYTGPVLAVFNESVVHNEFVTVFPMKDGATLSMGSYVFYERGLQVLSRLPVNITSCESVMCGKTEAEFVHILMLAVLGSFVVGQEGDGCKAPWVSDPVTGSLQQVDTFISNSILVFEVLVFILVISLARVWYVLHKNEEIARSKKRNTHTQHKKKAR